ncbi:hypothetical protein AZE42_13671 [Rhizopogon vesiculosus]|uniref:Uncharacterized protein n=1 Tax=Rhizopogon vesiculosus TaxID=180088 RepID=A0A1J8R151_9AGAM|nr:hypothetical protein AZE42_13671 [Rhizopogon vesiculosus]
MHYEHIYCANGSRLHYEAFVGVILHHDEKLKQRLVAVD